MIEQGPPNFLNLSSQRVSKQYYIKFQHTLLEENVSRYFGHHL